MLATLRAARDGFDEQIGRLREARAAVERLIDTIVEAHFVEAPFVEAPERKNDGRAPDRIIRSEED
jgi:hypothetical protein